MPTADNLGSLAKWKYIMYLGEGLTFDVTDVAGYANFTEDNFIVCADDFFFQTSGWTSGDTVTQTTSITYTKSYANGVLTVTVNGDRSVQVTSSGGGAGRTILGNLDNPKVYLVTNTKAITTMPVVGCISLTTVANDYQYATIKKSSNSIYVEWISGDITFSVYGRDDATSYGGTLIETFTLSGSSAKHQIDFGNYEYASIKHSVSSGMGRFKIFEE